MIKKSTRTYTVKRGDTVSKLIANRFGGRYGNLTYRQGIELFKSANPHIKDIDRIYAGQKIYMPDPSIREKNWYSNLFDKDGNLVEKMPEAAASEAAEKPRPAAAAAQRPPVAQPEDAGPAGEAASIIGGRLLNKGTYFFPMKQGRDFELDLSRYPMIDMGNGSKVVLTSQDKVMNVDLPLIQSYWEDVKVVKVSENASSREIIEAVSPPFPMRPQPTSSLSKTGLLPSGSTPNGSGPKPPPTGRCPVTPALRQSQTRPSKPMTPLSAT